MPSAFSNFWYGNDTPLSQCEALLWFSRVLAVTKHWLLWVAGAAGRVCCLEFFSPNVDVTLATTQSPLHWDEWKPPSCLRGVRWEFMTSGILLSTQAFLALQHSIVRGQDRLSLYGQESCHCPKYLRGSGSFWCGQKLLLCLELPRI